ncbi:DNA repair protein RecN [Sutterella wadsworthensis]|uniref:DNA repair protein RecN n=1 Tax=Sutterella wadsworthensis TaxID=40545 RepID=UPI001D08DD1B|nr:DNA repair protein RecN [Sutterella wadsworthensis]MCB7457263.1 DNA repair protein RecN [Sutterella wadsworthensis]
MELFTNQCEAPRADQWLKEALTMLTTLNLKDFVIVDQLSLDLSTGFTVLTGETGAGKSILIDAIQLIRGARADADMVRKGAERANIIAEFMPSEEALRWLETNDLQDSSASTVLVRRSIDKNGRSRAWINGITVTLSQLKELGDTLVDIQGQHAHQLLLKTQNQLKLLDAYAENTAQLEAVKKAFATWNAKAKRLEEASSSAEVRTAKIEQLTWLLEDLSTLAPKKGEWESLNEEHTRLSHGVSIIEGLTASVDWLTQGEDSASDLVSRAQSRVDDLSNYNERLKGVSETLTTAAELIDDAAHDLERILDKTEADSNRFEKVDRRVSKYFTMARKYRTEPEVLYAFEAENRRRLEELQNDENLDALRAEEAEARAIYDAAAERLTKVRREAAARFAKAVTNEMQTLSMKGGRFEVNLVPIPRSEVGVEKCEFLMAGHPGVDVSPLAKVASGGELSRIGLAIFTLTSRNTSVPTLIFDEVDSGVGGATGEVVGRMMKQLGLTRQVLCVTHLPQVAACGDHHLKVEKVSDGIETVSYLRELNPTQRVEEIARMLGGLLITQKTKVLAEEMVRANSGQKAHI